MSCLVFVELLSMFYFSLEDAGAKEDGQDQQAASSSDKLVIFKIFFIFLLLNFY